MNTRYLTPLPRLLAAALTQVLNTLLQHDPAAARRLAPLRQRVLGVSLQGMQIDLFFTVAEERFQVMLHNDNEPDTWVRGTPPALAGMGLGARATTTRPGAVQIQGDAELARAYQEFFNALDPDWEEALAQRFGDVIGHRLASLINQVRAAFNQLGRDSAAMTADYLKEESRLLVTREDMEGFLEAVDDLRDDVDRLAARLARLQAASL